MPALRHDGVDLHYDVTGDGPPVLLVAGLAADSAFYAPSLRALRSRFRVITIDNRGAGQTAPLDAPGSIATMADDCMALVRHLGLRRVSIVGHSMGGMIAQECALRHPDAVDRIVLAATAPYAGTRNNDLFATWATLYPVVERRLWFRNLFHWVLSPRFMANAASLSALVELAAIYPYQQTANALAGQVAAVAAFDSRTRVAAIRAGTLLLAGTRDLLFTIDDSAAFAAAIPHATFAAIDGAAHSFPIEAPDELTGRVADFLA